MPTRPSRRLCFSVTVTPTAKGGSRMSDTAQLAMVRAGVQAMGRPDGTLARWLQEKLIVEAFYSCEMGADQHAHFQGYHLSDTTHEQVPDDDTSMQKALAAAKAATGVKRKDAETKVRNTREKRAIDDLRLLLRRDIVETFFELERCSYTTKINVVKDEDVESFKGYPGKEQGQAHYVGVHIGIDEAALKRAIELAQSEAAEGNRANSKLNSVPGARKRQRTLSRKNMFHNGNWFEWREAIDLLDLPQEQLVRYMVLRGWQLDGQFLAATIHEKSTVQRVNAMRMLHKYPAMCNTPAAQTLVNCVIYGDATDGATSAEALDALFGEERQRLGMPTFGELSGLSLAQAKEVQATQRLPCGKAIKLREAYRMGDAVLVDLLATRGGRGVDAQNALKSAGLKTKSVTATDGDELLVSYASAGAACELLGLGVLFCTSFRVEDARRLATREAAVAMASALELLDDGNDGGAPLPPLGQMGIDEHVRQAAANVAPSLFEGVLRYDAFEARLRETMTGRGVDPADPAVHVAVVSSRAGSAHCFVAAWRLDPAHALELVRPSGASRPPGMGMAVGGAAGGDDDDDDAVYEVDEDDE